LGDFFFPYGIIIIETRETTFGPNNYGSSNLWHDLNNKWKTKLTPHVCCNGPTTIFEADDATTVRIPQSTADYLCVSHSFR
jgi:hypothetical protein